MLFIIAQILFFSPASLDEGTNPTQLIDPETLVEAPEPTLASGIPMQKIPEYTVDSFDYVSTVKGVKQWKLAADKAYLYNKEKLVHARKIRAFLYDPDGKITVVTGSEAKYFMNQRDLEIFGQVKTVLPDGFELYSEYLQYKPNDRHIIIPSKYWVLGDGKNELTASGEPAHNTIRFTSRGFDYAMGESRIILKESAHLTFVKDQPDPKTPGVSDTTTIESDRCVILRDQQLAHFTMDSKRPLSSRFVRITQPKLFTRARRADLNYGDFSDVLRYLIAYEDVLVREIPDEKSSDQRLRYGTGGRADFDTKQDVILLSEYPQVYQGDDTVTGDTILLHRDTDVVEVEHSNAYSQGTTTGDKP